MAKSAKREKQLKRKRAIRDSRNRNRSEKGNSNYARKKAYLHSHGEWGFDVPEPKPWR